MPSKVGILLFLSLLIERCTAQDYTSIDDIPIESYDHGDHQENDMDLELLPARHGRSSFLPDDPKTYFFSSFDDPDEFPFNPDVPRPDFQKRKRRDAPESDLTLSGLVRNLGEPLEVVVLETKNLTEKEEKAETKTPPEPLDRDDDLAINDFIRFRRSAEGDQEREKLIMEPSNEDSEADGTTKDHWTKQIYPVRKSDEASSLEDTLPSSSENIRAPRVHFVTQKFGDNRQASTDYRPYERVPRARYYDREPPPLRDTPRENPYYERRYRAFAPERYYRDDTPRYYNYRDVYRPRYDNYERIQDYNVAKPQKRIIYYATLPEISRTPPNVDLRDRYRYDRYRYDDDRYLNDPYRYRKSYPKARYEDEGKTPYPVKVLTDVNVREVKKNPERRIYSDVDRNRYAYNTPPYRAADG